MPLILPWWGVAGGRGTRAQLELTDTLIYNKASVIYTHEYMYAIDFTLMGCGGGDLHADGIDWCIDIQ